MSEEYTMLVSDLRELAETFREGSGYDVLLRVAADTIERLRLAQDRTCDWYDDECYMYVTGCGKAWQFEEGDLSENGVKYCPFCGGKVIDAAKEAAGERDAASHDRHGTAS